MKVIHWERVEIYKVSKPLTVNGVTGETCIDTVDYYGEAYSVLSNGMGDQWIVVNGKKRYLEDV